jgi:hypothetical protein
VYDLPSGAAGPRYELPDRDWVRLRAWGDDGVLVEEIIPTGPGRDRYARRCHWLDAAGRLADAPLLAGAAYGQDTRTWQTYWEAGGGWVAHVDVVAAADPTAVDRAAEWVDARLGTRVAPARRIGMQVRMLDAQTGAVRHELGDLPGPIYFAPDGERVAGVDPGRGLKVWEFATPWGRWAWTAAAFAAAAGGVLVVGRWRAARR